MIIKTQMPAYGGYVIARDNGVIFINGAIPEEVVEISIIEKKRDYSIARVNSIVEPSPDRIEPSCPLFGLCGGCQFQFISYERQVKMKEEILLDAVSRIGGIEIALEPSLTDSDYSYRHRGQFKISSDGLAGFYRESTREVVPVNECLLMKPEINAVLKNLSNILAGTKEIHISCGDSINALIKFNNSHSREKYFTSELENKLREIGLSGIAFENGESVGRDYITLDLNGIQYTVTPWSFFQSHWELNKKAVSLIAGELNPSAETGVLDLYAGAGNFSMPLAKQGAQVIAVEENNRAIEDGQRNTRLNSMENCNFVLSSAEKYKISKKPDIIILDPPRTGLTKAVIEKVISASPSRIAYISCNPATLSRDLKKLKEKYNIDSLRLIDFFPNTYHIEAVALLGLR